MLKVTNVIGAWHVRVRHTRLAISNWQEARRGKQTISCPPAKGTLTALSQKRPSVIDTTIYRKQEEQHIQYHVAVCAKTKHGEKNRHQYVRVPEITQNTESSHFQGISIAYVSMYNGVQCHILSKNQRSRHIAKIWTYVAKMSASTARRPPETTKIWAYSPQVSWKLARIVYNTPSLNIPVEL